MARKTRTTYRQRKARKEALQLAALSVGAIVALPFVVLFAGVVGDVMARTTYTAQAINALLSLI